MAKLSMMILASRSGPKASRVLLIQIFTYNCWIYCDDPNGCDGGLVSAGPRTFDGRLGFC